MRELTINIQQYHRHDMEYEALRVLEAALVQPVSEHHTLGDNAGGCKSDHVFCLSKRTHSVVI